MKCGYILFACKQQFLVQNFNLLGKKMEKKTFASPKTQKIDQNIALQKCGQNLPFPESIRLAERATLIRLTKV